MRGAWKASHEYIFELHPKRILPDFQEIPVGGDGVAHVTVPEYNCMAEYLLRQTV
ncbi:MAG: hypothetical protein ACLTKI_07865 [Lachnospiraceae bacterium]